MKELYSGFWDGPHATPKESDSGPIYLGIKNITEDGQLDFSDIRHISEEDYPTWIRRVEPKPGDIVFTYEATLHRYAIIPEGFRGCLGRRLALLRLNPSVVNTRFLFYYFFGQEWRKTVSKYMILGATVDRIPIIEFPNFEVYLPPLPTQRKIAAILSAYDDLIENNTRRIRILEQMAQAVYREWFVHFRFPGHEGVRMVDGLPEGWEIVKVEEIINRVSAGKRYEEKTILPDGFIPVLDQGRSGIIGYHNDDPGVLASEESPIIVFANHTCYQKIIQYPFSAIQNVIPFIPLAKDRDIYWLHWATKDLIKFNDYKGHWPEYMGKELLLPPEYLSDAFGSFAKPIVRLIYKFEKKNTILRRTRDLLLPQLVSGEVEV